MDLIRAARGDGNQATLAARVGVTQGTISAWERGASLPPRPRIPALAAALGRPLDEIEAMVASERASPLRAVPAPARVPVGNPAAVPIDMQSVMAAEARLVRKYIDALADGHADRAELEALLVRAEAAQAAAANLIRDIKAALEAEAAEPEVMA
jgi:transcriptional regulator with XRE-family HTH domain